MDMNHVMTMVLIKIIGFLTIDGKYDSFDFLSYDSRDICYDES